MVSKCVKKLEGDKFVTITRSSLCKCLPDNTEIVSSTLSSRTTFVLGSKQPIKTLFRFTTPH